MVMRGIVVIENSKISSSFQPKVSRQARMNAGRVVILFAVGSHGQECVIQIRSIRVAFHLVPIVILQHDDKYGFERRHGIRKGKRGQRKHQGEKKAFLHRANLQPSDIYYSPYFAFVVPINVELKSAVETADNTVLNGRLSGAIQPEMCRKVR